MAHEQAFEHQGEENLPASHRQWQPGEEAEPDIATMVEVYDVMTGVNQRLAEQRAKPFKRTVGDIAAGAATFFLSVSILDSFRFRAEEILLTAPALIAVLVHNHSLNRLDKMQAALTLQEYDKRWIGPLFEALAWPNRRIRQIVRLKLVNLLPLMTEADARFLSRKQRTAIYTLLQETRDSTLKLAILKAIHHFGDFSALEIVEKLASGRAWTPTNRGIRRAALISLPLLRERVRQLADRTPEPLDSVSEFARDPLTIGESIGEAGLERGPIATPSQNASSLAKLEVEREKVARPSMRMGFLIADWCIIVPFGLMQTIDSFAHAQLLVGGFWTVFTAAATQLYRVSLSSKRVALLRKQAQQRDIKAVGALAEALSWPELDIQYEAGSALKVILPLLKASDAPLLNPTQRECLHQVLKLSNARTQSDLMIAILRAFQQVGDNAAIPFVEELASATARTPLEKKVVLEAQECLPYLRICAGNNTASHTLLRASSVGDTAAAHNLLRPAWENPETRPEQLLRPSDLDDR